MKGFKIFFILFLTTPCLVYTQTGNTFHGDFAGASITTGDYNSFMGRTAGNLNENGHHNSFMGSYSGRLNISGSHNSFMGSDAGYRNKTGFDNSFMGSNAGYNNSTGYYNSFMGRSAGYSNTGGYYNSFMGKDAGYKNKTGSYNSFMGTSAGYSNTIGSDNCYMGYSAGRYNTTGSSNSFTGSYAGYSSEGSSNSFMGKNAGHYSEGDYNSFMGTSAGYSNTGSYNSFMGSYAGYRNKAGSGNVTIGRGAGPTTANSGVHMRLYIDVDTLSTSGNDEPLIYGEFDNDFVRINGTFEVTGGVSNGSSIDLKENLTIIDRQDILDKVAGLPLQSWNYITQPGVPHIGATAEDFYAAFGYGASDKVISTIDADGIAIAAIQALIGENQRLEKKIELLTDENRMMKKENIKLWRAIDVIQRELSESKKK